MATRVGTGWQTIIADLSLILFMATASGISHQQKPHVVRAPAPSARSEPLAVWVGGKGAPALTQWLAQQTRDSRQQVTIRAAYAPGQMDAALVRARALALQAGDGARIVVEPGPHDERVVIAFDAAPSRLARPVRGASDTAMPKDHR